MNIEPKKILETQYDECNISGICSISPSFAAIKAAIFACLQELAFYIKKARSFGARNPKIQNDFIDIFAVLITNSEYSDAVLKNLILTIQANLAELKTLYKQLCEEKQVQHHFFKSSIKLGKDFEINDFVKQGQKYSDKFKKNLSKEQNQGYELILAILKSICLYIIELQGLNIDFEKYYEELVEAFCINKLSENSLDRIKEYMKKYVEIDNELMNVVFEARKKDLGEFIETEISLSAKEGKAILVAGANIKELELLLEATKDKGISVYTHGQMITGHIFPKLKAYPHLVGHWGQGAEHYMSDFYSFPGVIFLTKLSLFKVETLYFNRFFTTNRFAPKNTTTIENYNFEPLIQAALSAEGFSETIPGETIKAGIIEENYMNKVYEILEEIKKEKINNIIFIGVPNKINLQMEYFKNFFMVLPEKSFVFSYYCESENKNVFFNNIDYALPFLYRTLDILSEEKQNHKLKINVFFTRCEPHTISNIIELRYKDVDNIYFHQCSPMLINPALVDFLIETFEIKRYTTPENDFWEMTK